MTSSSTDVGGAGTSSWVSIVANTKSDLNFVEKSRESLVYGVLKISREVLKIGEDKLNSAIVAQFLGTIPPIRVIRNMLNRLWGFEGEV
ncbi:hypothetical protein LINPERHAP1_LOCUS38698 [Linum perenne]